MTQMRRIRAPGATIFFHVALRDPNCHLLTQEINLLRFAVAKTLADWPVHVEAWSVLPNQMLCMWTLPEGDCDYSTRWRLIKSRFSRALPMSERRVSDIKRGERGIWQRRFWEHHIRGPFDFEMHRRRCYTAPADFGFVADPAEWVFSSFYKQKQIPKCVA